MKNFIALSLLPAALIRGDAIDVEKRVQHGYADSSGVKIHYASLGQGSLIIMIHGFPDYWFSWRHQMDALSKNYQVVAIDMRGYNLSDKPKGVENYDIKLLVGDVIAVIKHFGKDKAIVVGHDWGGAVAWMLATVAPEMVDKLIIFNLPHPRNLNRELANNPEQQKNSQYARDFQQESAHTKLTAQMLAQFAPANVREQYTEAFKRSDLEALLNYYKRNYPREPYKLDTSPVVKVKAPVLQFHGLKDTALLPGALNGTWELVEQDWTLITIPNAGHWSQWDAAELTTKAMEQWLAR